MSIFFWYLVGDVTLGIMQSIYQRRRVLVGGHVWDGIKKKMITTTINSKISDNLILCCPLLGVEGQIVTKRSRGANQLNTELSFAQCRGSDRHQT